MPKDTWTARTPRPLSPFFGAAELETLLDRATLAAQSGDTPSEEPRRILTEEVMEHFNPLIDPAIEGHALRAALGDAAQDYDLVVTARLPALMQRRLVSRFPCKDPFPDEIELTQEVIREARLTGRVLIGLAVCRHSDAEGHVASGWPVHAGAIIAQKVFDLGIDRQMSPFRIEILDEAMRDSRKLPQGTSLVVDVVSSEEDDEGPIATVYMAETLVQASRNSRTPQAFHEVTLATILDAVLEEGAKLWDDDAYRSGGAGARLAETLGFSDGAALRERVRQPNSRRAIAQSAAGLTRALEAIK